MSRVPPHNLEAERAILGAGLLQAKMIDAVTDLLKPDDFYSEAHGRIFEVMVAMHAAGTPVDSLTLGEELTRTGKIKAVGDREYIMGLTDTIPIYDNVRSYAEIVSEKAIARRLIDVAQAIAARGYGDYGPLREYTDFAEKEVFAACSKQTRTNAARLKQLITETFEDISVRSKSGERVSGLKTGFIGLDNMTAGMHPGDLIIVAGRPGMGKTSLAMNVATNACFDRHRSRKPAKVMVFSLEMPKKQLTQRLLASEARVDSGRMRTGMLVPEDWPPLAQAAGDLSDLPFDIDDTASISMVELRSKARRAMSEEPLCLVVIDYLQLMRSGSKHDSREQEISEISRSLKGLAKELEIPIIALSQLNRGVESRGNKDKRPGLSDLRESGAIEQDADTIWFVYRDEVYNRETMDQGIAELIVGKQRAGPTGTVRLRFMNAYTRFENLAEEQDGIDPP